MKNSVKFIWLRELLPPLLAFWLLPLVVLAACSLFIIRTMVGPREVTLINVHHADDECSLIEYVGSNNFDADWYLEILCNEELTPAAGYILEGRWRVERNTDEAIFATVTYLREWERRSNRPEGLRDVSGKQILFIPCQADTLEECE